MSGNIRLFEATGMGALLITENSENIAEFFSPGIEIVTYRSTDELVQLIHYYMRHRWEAREIADRGQQRTLTDHNTHKRSEELLFIFQKYSDTNRNFTTVAG